jgi:2-methylcitrate dehydratase PrpD
MSGQIEMQTLVEKLAVRLCRPVAPHLRIRAGLHLLDWLGCAIAGSRENAGRKMLQARPAGPSGDAFAWGALGNILEMDDVDKRATLHPGPTLVPAVLALAAHDGASPDAILDAIVTGYEATVRLGRAAGAGHYAFWHSTGTCGSIGAAAACSRLLGLSPSETAQALSLAMSQATGLWQTRHEAGSMGKQLHTAHAARSGYDAARLAAAGFCGPLEILEGPQGFFAATCPGSTASDILADYGTDWLIEQVSFKPWPACRHAHAAIDAAILVRGDSINPADISAVHVTTYPDALKFCDKPEPRTPIEAKFSLQHSVAVILLRGKPTLADFDISSIRDPALTDLRTKVRVEAGDPYTLAYPARFGAKVEVTFAGHAGKTICRSVPDALGDPENPLSRAQIEDKAMMLMQHAGVTDTDAAAMVEACQRPGDTLLVAIRRHLS